MAARTPNEVIEDGVRTRLQERLVAAGVHQAEVALEVLYWLPVGFLREYTELYMKALALGDGSTGREKAGSDEGRVVAKVPAKLRGTEKGGLAAQGGGKRYKVEWVVKDEQALKLKERMDRKLAKLADEMSSGMKRGNGGNGGGEGQTRGSIPGRDPRGGPQVAGKVKWEFDEKGERLNGRCEDCGKIMRHDWARCPFHDA